jgi:hypothetical protein
MGLQHQFFEPDLGDQLTAVVFLVDERVLIRCVTLILNQHHYLG